MLSRIGIALAFAMSFAMTAMASTATHFRDGLKFDHVIFVLFENTDYADAIRQPFFKKLADQGAHFTNFRAETHPSQANYIALTAGDLHGVRGDGDVDLEVANVADLLEAKGLTWKVYAEGYPGNCFQGDFSGSYARKHNPFISFTNIQNNAARCTHIVNASEFDRDLAGGMLPNYSFFIPNQQNDGHDTGVAFADRWYKSKFAAIVGNPAVMARTLLISTFDEDGGSSRNQIYTSLVGPGVRPGTIVAAQQDHYSLLRLIEENWALGNFNLRDATAASVPNNIWQ